MNIFRAPNNFNAKYLLPTAKKAMLYHVLRTNALQERMLKMIKDRLSSLIEYLAKVEPKVESIESTALLSIISDLHFNDWDADKAIENGLSSLKKKNTGKNTSISEEFIRKGLGFPDDMIIKEDYDIIFHNKNEPTIES